MNYIKFEHKEKNIFLVDMNKEQNYFFSELFIKWLKKVLLENWNIVILHNKKWYDSWMICQKCGYIPKCSNCDIAISYYQTEQWKIWICNLCKSTYNPINVCPKCGNTNLNFYWIGLQKIQEFIYQKFQVSSLIVDSTKTNSPNKIKKLFEEIHNYQIILSTSIFSHPPKNYKTDLLVFFDVDTWLQIPDFNSESKVFYFIYNTIKKYDTKNIIIQTRNIDNLAIKYACELDKKSFVDYDNNFRKNNWYPPFATLCLILYKNENETSLFNRINNLYQELLFLKQKYEFDLQIYKSPPLIFKKHNKYHYNIVLKWKNLRHFMEIVISKLNLLEKWFKIDRNAQSLL